MNRERIDDLIDILTEQYEKLENTFVIKNGEELLKFLDNPKEWKKRQLLHRNGYRKELIAEARARIELLDKMTEKVYYLANVEVDKDIIEVTADEIIIKDDDPEVSKKVLKQIHDMNVQEVSKLADQTFKMHTATVRLVDSLATPDNLYDVVKEYTKKGVENGIKVVYKNGRVYKWKSYMEMNIRTTIHQEIADRQIRVGAKANQIFYICTHFGDSAPDHAPYQDKLYYNPECDIPKDVMDFIEANDVLDMIKVQQGEPFLCTRPNCRHNLIAIPTEQAMGKSVNQIQKDEGVHFGEYKSTNYARLMEQRANERAIRKWKLEKENAQILGQKTGDKDLLSKAKQYQSKVSEYQKKQRELVAANKNVLKRDYSRENAKYLVDNLGVRYDYRVVNGELKPKK